MKKMKKLFFIATLLGAFTTGSVYGNDCNSCCAPAYNDCCDCSYLSAAAPIAVLVIAAIVIATTGNSHHHSSSSSCCTSSSSSSHCH